MGDDCLECSAKYFALIRFKIKTKCVSSDVKTFPFGNLPLDQIDLTFELNLHLCFSIYLNLMFLNSFRPTKNG